MHVSAEDEIELKGKILDGRFISWLYVPIFQMLRPQKTWEFYRLILIRKGKIYHSRTVEVIIHLSEAREDWNRGSDVQPIV